jgi:broad specificity phosphatase PhoE
MTETRFWMIRHAIVEENARLRIYGNTDVELCPHSLEAQVSMYAALARRLPRPGDATVWLSSPLSRAQKTGAAIFAAGYPEQALTVEPGLIELDFGAWQGLSYQELPHRLTMPPHGFWPIAGDERPPGGESMADGIARVGSVMERLARSYAGTDVVALTHGGAIRAAVAHGLRVGADNALHLSVENLSLTRLDRLDQGWRVVCVNELPGV